MNWTELSAIGGLGVVVIMTITWLHGLYAAEHVKHRLELDATRKELETSLSSLEKRVDSHADRLSNHDVQFAEQKGVLNHISAGLDELKASVRAIYDLIQRK